MKLTPAVAMFSRVCVTLVVGTAMFAMEGMPVVAQETLPRPEPPFKGRIGRTSKESLMVFIIYVERRFL